METQEKNMELNEESPNVGMEDGQSGRIPDQTDNEVRLESEFVEFTESNEDNETIETVNVNCESDEVKLEPEFIDNNEFTESNKDKENFLFVQTVIVNCEPDDVNLESEVTESNEITKPNEFTESNEFTEPNEFTESNEFTEPNEFTESNEDNAIKLTSVKTANVNKTFVRLIAEALDSAPGGMLAAIDICKAINAKHPQYKMNNSNWKKVWNNLSRNKNFVKGTKPKSWKLKEDHKILLHKRKVEKKVERKVQISKSFDPYMCDLCNAQFAQTRNLARHFQTVHEKKMSFKCTICRKVFGAKQTLERHLLSVHKLGLDESKKLAFLQKPTNNDAKEFDEKKRPFCCSICDKAFAAKQTLQRHVANIHKQDYYSIYGEKPFPIKNAEKKEKKYRKKHGSAALFDFEKLECKTCDGSFATKNAFVYHMQQFHAVAIEI